MKRIFYLENVAKLKMVRQNAQIQSNLGLLKIFFLENTILNCVV